MGVHFCLFFFFSSFFIPEPILRDRPFDFLCVCVGGGGSGLFWAFG